MTNRDATPPSVLEVTNLETRFFLRSAVVRAVDGVSLDVESGETLALVGESGSGKTATIMSILRLLPKSGRVVSGSVRLEGDELLSLSEKEFGNLRGSRMALVPQTPMSALNPMYSIGWQLDEVIRRHTSVSRAEARDRTVSALAATGIPAPAEQLDRFPHEFSGGMRQRILIAMALVNDPSLLLADEPTTALDTTTQAQILDLLRTLTATHKMATLLVTHNMGVVASIADRVAVMHAGEIVESGSTLDVFGSPLHPYTQLLLTSTLVGGNGGGSARRRRAAQTAAATSAPPTDGSVGGCRYRARCPVAVAACSDHPELRGSPGHAVRCWVAKPSERASNGAAAR